MLSFGRIRTASPQRYTDCHMSSKGVESAWCGTIIDSTQEKGKRMSDAGCVFDRFCTRKQARYFYIQRERQTEQWRDRDRQGDGEIDRLTDGKTEKTWKGVKREKKTQKSEMLLHLR